MPIMQSPSYHGYDVTDYYAVNKDYGTNEDFKRLMAEAHKRGIKVITDLVLNHTSSEHPWFVEARDNPESERRDWYLWSEEKPDYLGPWGQEVWHDSPSGLLLWPLLVGDARPEPREPPGDRRDAEGRPLLAGRPRRGWLPPRRGPPPDRGGQHPGEHAGDPRMAGRGSARVYKAANPEALVVGEMWTKGPNVVEYLQGDELDLAFDFDLAEAVVTYVGYRTANRVQGALGTSYGLYGSGLSATFLTNHDMNRVMSVLRGDVGKAKLAASVLMTAPGVPFVYYGEEIGMTGQKPDEMIRTPMQWSAEENAGFSAGTPWEPVNGDYAEKNVAAQAQDPASLLSHYRALIHLRAGHPALQMGDYSPVDSTDAGLLAFLRASDEETVLVILNLRRGSGARLRPGIERRTACRAPTGPSCSMVGRQSCRIWPRTAQVGSTPTGPCPRYRAAARSSSSCSPSSESVVTLPW